MRLLFISGIEHAYTSFITQRQRDVMKEPVCQFVSKIRRLTWLLVAIVQDHKPCSTLVNGDCRKSLCARALPKACDVEWVLFLE
ncbi:hypothetical protein A3764_15015 [Sulfitobacter sp. HI0129]|nr:hypothetical protein A3764_15015 [Sulfitobacter sp. HI0129]